MYKYIWLKKLYDGNIKNGKGLIIIKEKDVEYDLLERGHIINNLKKLFDYYWWFWLMLIWI